MANKGYKFKVSGKLKQSKSCYTYGDLNVVDPAGGKHSVKVKGYGSKKDYGLHLILLNPSVDDDETNSLTLNRIK